MSHVPDAQLRKAAGEDVTFVFSLEVDGAKIAEMQERALALAEKKRKENPLSANKDREDEDEDDATEEDSDDDDDGSSTCCVIIVSYRRRERRKRTKRTQKKQ